jgi:hypothetical protein
VDDVTITWLQRTEARPDLLVFRLLVTNTGNVPLHVDTTGLTVVQSLRLSDVAPPRAVSFDRQRHAMGHRDIQMSRPVAPVHPSTRGGQFSPYLVKPETPCEIQVVADFQSARGGRDSVVVHRVRLELNYSDGRSTVDVLLCDPHVPALADRAATRGQIIAFLQTVRSGRNKIDALNQDEGRAPIPWKRIHGGTRRPSLLAPHRIPHHLIRNIRLVNTRGRLTASFWRPAHEIDVYLQARIQHLEALARVANGAQYLTCRLRDVSMADLPDTGAALIDLHELRDELSPEIAEL